MKKKLAKRELKQKQILLRLYRKVDSSRYLWEMVLQVRLYNTDTCIPQCIQFVYSRIVIWVWARYWEDINV